MADDVNPAGGALPKTFGAKTSFMLGPLVLFLIVGVGISFAILWVMAGNLQEKLDTEAKRAQAAETKLVSELKKANDDLAAEQAKVKDLTEKHEKLRKEKEELAEGLKSAITSLETVSSSLQNVHRAGGLQDDHREDGGVARRCHRREHAADRLPEEGRQRPLREDYRRDRPDETRRSVAQGRVHHAAQRR